MEGMRDVALAHYETLPDDKKTEIQRTFRRTVEERSVREYFDRFNRRHKSEIVEKCLTSCEEYEEGRLDFNNFITLRYILKNLRIGKCNECLSLIIGKPFFSCYECFMDSDVDSYDLCCGCYGSKKFEGHDHVKFYDSQTLHYLRSKTTPARKKRKLEDVTEKMIVDFACDLMKKARSIKTEEQMPIVDHKVLNLDKNKKLDEISRLAKQLKEKSNGKNETVESSEKEDHDDSEDEENSTRVRRRIDVLGAKASYTDSQLHRQPGRGKIPRKSW